MDHGRREDSVDPVGDEAPTSTGIAKANITQKRADLNFYHDSVGLKGLETVKNTTVASSSAFFAQPLCNPVCRGPSFGSRMFVRQSLCCNSSQSEIYF